MASKMKFLAVLVAVIASAAYSHQSFPAQPLENWYLKKTSDSASRVEDVKFRLGTQTKPSHYNIDLNFDIAAGPVFNGTVDITFTTQLTGLREIILNADTIEITDVKIKKAGITIPPSKDIYDSYTPDEKYQKITFKTNADLEVNKTYIITIKYNGKMFEDLTGVYLSNYKQGTANKTMIATSFGQFARRMMPCWDEPQFKATFKFVVTRNENMRSFSNAVIERTVGNKDTFKETSLISTYILALVISEFEYKKNKEAKFGVLARPDASKDMDYALEVGPKLIKAFDEWTDMPYYQIAGVDKMDLGAIPDFAAGAMENWGLILHKEVYSLYNKDYANTAQKQLIPTVISHELAHMWFGDIVTCNWYDETYLNEGFARYFQFIGLDVAEPTFKGMMQFPVTSTQRSMQTDQTPATFALSNPGMFSLPDITNMYGTISYDKGGSILRMAHNLMGDTKFKSAIRSYLKKRKMATAVTEDLLTELEVQDAGITDVVAPYIKQAGFPLVTVTRIGDNMLFTQRRFLVESREHNDTTQWTIPITFATKTEDFTNVKANLAYLKAFSQEPLTINVTNMKNASYFIANVQQVGYYRVNYDEQNWRLIEKALKSAEHGGIHVLNRAQIIDDLFNLARSGDLSYDFVFSIVNYIELEEEFLPWLAFLSGINHLDRRIVKDPLKKFFDSFMNKMLEKITTKTSFEDGGDDFMKMMRMHVLQWSCKFGNQKNCVEKAMDLFDNKVMKGENIVSDLKPAVYCTGLRMQSDKWSTMWEKFANAGQATEQEMILQGLGCAKNAEDLNKFMDKILTTDVRVHDKGAAYSSVISGNHENVDVVLDYIIANTTKWSAVMDVVSTLGDLSSCFTNAEQFDKLEKHANTLKEEWKTPLLAKSKDNRKLLVWDQERLPELLKFLDSSAASTKVSLMVVLLVVAKYFLF